MKTAKAAVFCGDNKAFEVKEYPITEPKTGTARLRLVASGVCGTDIHIHNGKISMEPPKIIGHEFVGQIDAISNEDSAKFGFKKGDYAIVDIACPCGKCKLCKNGDDANCVNMGVTNGGNPEEEPYFHGGYGEVSYAPLENLIKLPENVDPLAACVFACPGPTAFHSFALAKQAGCNVEKANVAVVQGTGPVGCMAISYLSALEVPNIIAFSGNISDESKELVKKLGASEIINVREKNENELLNIIMNYSNGLGADIVFEASGSPKAIPTGLNILRNRGVYLVPGQYSNSGGIEIQPQLITFKALHIVGSSQYSLKDVNDFVSFLADKPELQETIKRLAACYPVTDINRAIEDAKAGKNVKTVLIP